MVRGEAAMTGFIIGTIVFVIVSMALVFAVEWLLKKYRRKRRV